MPVRSAATIVAQEWAAKAESDLRAAVYFLEPRSAALLVRDWRRGSVAPQRGPEIRMAAHDEFFDGVADREREL
ncbi:MAG: hypothetical protein A3G20_04265 [Acidobacteria bacterium RIFCSPLOWO2_12_FULL_59_11]|nr:MAG: hypothetical protein A3G20_04265 [Acidobacteria bacterium RIFCSPLOWO2_12_FULL_59_11]